MDSTSKTKEERGQQLTFDKDTFKAFRIDFAAAVKELEAKYDIAIRIGEITYTEGEFSGRLTCRSNDATLRNANPLMDLMVKSAGIKTAESGLIGSTYVIRGRTSR